MKMYELCNVHLTQKCTQHVYVCGVSDRTACDELLVRPYKRAVKSTWCHRASDVSLQTLFNLFHSLSTTSQEYFHGIHRIFKICCNFDEKLFDYSEPRSRVEEHNKNNED